MKAEDAFDFLRSEAAKRIEGAERSLGRAREMVYSNERYLDEARGAAVALEKDIQRANRSVVYQCR